MKSCEELKKVMEQGFDIFFTNTGIDVNDGDDIMIEKIENDFESKKKLITDENKFQEIKSELSENEENEESIKKYFIEILKTKDSTTLLALHSYYIETLKGYVNELNRLQMGGATFSQPQPTNKDPYGVVDTDGVVVTKGEALYKLAVGAIFGIVGLSLLGIAIFSGGALAPAVGVGVFGGIFFIGGLIIRDKAEQNFIEDFQGLIKDEKGNEISRLRTTLPRNGLIRGALRTFTNHYNIRTTFSDTKEYVKNIPSAVTNFMSHTEASKRKKGEPQSGGEIDNLCKSIQTFMEENNIEEKLEKIENPPEEQKKDLNPFEKLTAQFNEQRKGTDEAIKKAEGYLPRDKQGGRRMRKVKGKSLKKRGGRKSIKKGVKKVVKKGGRKSVRKTLNKRGRKSVRR